jgi:hypothetical protein
MAAHTRLATKVSEREGPQYRGHRRAQGTANPAPTGPIAVPEPPKRRWDQLDDEERRRLSAEIARQEALAQGTPLVATPRQHRLVAAIINSVQPDAQRRQKPA